MPWAAPCLPAPTPRTVPLRLAGVHLYADNIGPRLTYWDVGEPLPAQAGLSAEVMPFALREDISDIIGLRITAGAKKIADMPLVAGGALRRACSNGSSSAPATITRSIASRFPWDWVPGLASMWDISAPTRGGSTNRTIFGSVWAVSVRLNLREVVQKTAEDYYTTAQRFYQRNRKFLCVLQCEKGPCARSQHVEGARAHRHG